MHELAAIEDEALKRIASAEKLDALEALRVMYLGKSGTVTSQMKQLAALSPEERKTFGAKINALRDALAAAIDTQKKALAAIELQARLATEAVDVTLPARAEAKGRIHPVTQVIEEITAIFARQGFSVAEGPDVEDDWHNFTALNIPPTHPARQMHDTFYLQEKDAKGQKLLLRTHTSPVQIRVMSAGQNNKSGPPFRAIAPGSTYRCDSDLTHTPMFHQVEGFIIDKGIHMGHLKGCIIDFLRAFFELPEVPVRFRPSFFPFTEPSAEVDIGCKRSRDEIKIGAGEDWLEVMGCGMVHPNVLKNCNINPDEWQGFAFGMGVERLAMLKYGIPDLRTFFESDARWLQHYGFAPLDIPGGRMKFTLSWLKEHLATEAPAGKIGETLTAVGLEVEDVADPAARLKDFIVAEILEAAPHPNAGKLQVCKVNDGERVRQIVCGAANARAGLKVALAREGVFIPGSGITIKKTKIRDVESDGMLCSAEELQLAEKSEGIIELPASAKPGTPLAGAMGAADPVFTIAVTPNRADCLGIYGIARDLAAAGLGTLKPLPAAIHAGKEPCPIKVSLETPECPLFIGCLIRGVKNGPSPAWLQQRLSAIGLRPISALVDITNYFTYAFGRPLHVFDAAKLKGDIVVRPGKGETLKALNGKEYTLDSTMTVIADSNAVRALGGIVGGEDTGCTEATTDVFLEAAYFNPANIAQTGRKLDIISDARYRFERGVDPAFTETGARLAVQMITELCGGSPSALVTAGKTPEQKRSIALTAVRVESLGGVAVPVAECERILTTLGFSAEKQGNGWNVTPPSWRADVEYTADLVEEIIRIHGYANIPAVSVPASAATSALNPMQKRTWQARRALASRGMMEVCSWSFLPSAHAALFGSAQPILLQNPISAELDALRPSLLPNLLTAAKNNIARSIAELHLFEVGAQWSSTKAQEQKSAAAGIRIGNRGDAAYDDGHYAPAETAHDVFSAKADAYALLETLGMNAGSVAVTRSVPAWYHPGRSGALTLGGKIVLGYFGEVHPGICQQFDIEHRVAAFELFVDAIPQPRAKGTAKPMLNASAFQPVARDFAFVVKNEITAAQITQALAQADKTLVKSIQLLSVWSGKGIEDGSKSVAVRVTLQAADRTLTDADITTVSSAIVAAAGTFGGTLRQ